MSEPVGQQSDVALRMRARFAFYRSQGQSIWIEAAGTSMEPVIRPGNLLLVDFASEKVEIGEIALFALGERIAAHRVVRRERTPQGEFLTTRGDANVHRDPPLPPANVLGVVRALRRTPEGDPETVMCHGPRAVALARASAAIGALDDAAARLPPLLRRPPAKIARIARSTGFAAIARTTTASARIFPAAPAPVTGLPESSASDGT
jgi:Peptidase S24-like